MDFQLNLLLKLQIILLLTDVKVMVLTLINSILFGIVQKQKSSSSETEALLTFKLASTYSPIRLRRKVPSVNTKNKKAPDFSEAFLLKIGIDILSQALGQVPSAQAGLTTLFGMGRGDPRRYRRHKGIVKREKESGNRKTIFLLTNN